MRRQAATYYFIGLFILLTDVDDDDDGVKSDVWAPQMQSNTRSWCKCDVNTGSRGGKGLGTSVPAYRCLQATAVESCYELIGLSASSQSCGQRLDSNPTTDGLGFPQRSLWFLINVHYLQMQDLKANILL